MAFPARFDEANLLLTPPIGAEDAVVPMPVRRLDGQIVSCWRLDVAELAEILRTGEIWLSVWGQRSAPPVMVTAFKHEVI